MTAVWQYLDAHLWAAVVALLAVLSLSAAAILWAGMALAARDIHVDDGEY